MALTKTGTDGIKDDAVTADKLANAINTDIAAKAVLTGSTNNTVTTVTGANAIQGEANLTFDGTSLKVGASTSTRPISIYSASDAQIQFQGSGTGTGNNNADGFIVGNSGGVDATLWNYEDGYLRFATNNTERGRFESGGAFQVQDNIKIMTSGKGIDFSANSDGPGTSVSELFHIYEEGYWVPTWNNNFSLESSYTHFQYTRVGRLVTVRGYVYPSSWSGSDAIYLTLPFASLNDAGAANSGAQGCMFKYLDGCTGGLASFVGDNASAMYFYRCESGNSNYSALTTGNLQSGALWYFSHTYAAA